MKQTVKTLLAAMKALFITIAIALTTTVGGNATGHRAIGEPVFTDEYGNALDESVIKTEEADQSPEFPGGEEAMQKYIHSHFIMPSWCQDGDIQGTVKVAFVVSATGQVTQAAITKSLDSDIDAEALRVVRSLPKFHPATINGKPVDCLQTTTIHIRISD